MSSLVVLALLDEILASSSDEPSPSGGDESDLLSVGSISSDRGWVANMLMVTTTMRMFNGVHGYTTYSGPGRVLLGLLLVVSCSSLQERLLESTTSSTDAYHGSADSRDGLPGA